MLDLYESQEQRAQTAQADAQLFESLDKRILTSLNLLLVMEVPQTFDEKGNQFIRQQDGIIMVYNPYSGKMSGLESLSRAALLQAVDTLQALPSNNGIGKPFPPALWQRNAGTPLTAVTTKVATTQIHPIKCSCTTTQMENFISEVQKHIATKDTGDPKQIYDDVVDGYRLLVKFGWVTGEFSIWKAEILDSDWELLENDSAVFAAILRNKYY